MGRNEVLISALRIWGWVSQPRFGVEQSPQMPPPLHLFLWGWGLPGDPGRPWEVNPNTSAVWKASEMERSIWDGRKGRFV